MQDSYTATTKFIRLLYNFIFYDEEKSLKNLESNNKTNILISCYSSTGYSILPVFFW